MAQKQFNSSVTGKPTLTGTFRFDPDTGNVSQYNCGCCNGICAPNNISWNSTTKYKQFSITCGGATYTFSGTYTPVPNGQDYFANGSCSFPSLRGDEEDWTATARRSGEDELSDVEKTTKKRKPTKKSKPAKKAKPAKKVKPAKKARKAKKPKQSDRAKASKKAKPAKKAARATKSSKSAKSAKKR